MFSKLLKSTARKSLLEIFINNSRQKYYLRELAVMINYSPGSLQRELNSLVDDGLLATERTGNLRFFSLNPKSPYVKELKLYFQKHSSPAKPEGSASEKVQNKPQKRVPKPVLERHMPSSSDRETSAPVAIDILPPTRPQSDYAPPISQVPKPVLTKPILQKPVIIPPKVVAPTPVPLPAPIPEPKLESQPQPQSDYPDARKASTFYYSEFQSDEPDTHDAKDMPSNTPYDTLSYKPEIRDESFTQPSVISTTQEPIHPDTHPTTQNEPPDEATDDIRLHID